jgi:glycosyltransferase involved in cell wall biosynthesis
MGLNIGMILDGPLKPDARVQKEAHALEAAGHRVHLLVGEQVPPEPEIPELRIQHLPLPRGWRGTLRAFRSAWSFTDPTWKPAILRFAREKKIDALHVHDLPLVQTATRVARKLGIKVVADLHENYPYLLQRIVDTRRWQYRYLFGYERWRRYEARAVLAVDRVIVVIEEARDRLEREAGLDPSRVTVVANYDLLDDDPPVPPPAGGLELLYVGVINDHRGLDTTIDALPGILAVEPRARLTIVGDGPDRGKIERRVSARGVGSSVRFLGWKQPPDVKIAIREAHVGLVPHEKNPLTDATIPNKLFSYMIAERPVLVSDCKPLERIVRDARSGLVFRSGDAKDLARAALELRDPLRRAEFGKQGRLACRERYHWGEATRALCGLYGPLEAVAR